MNFYRGIARIPQIDGLRLPTESIAAATRFSPTPSTRSVVAFQREISDRDTPHLAGRDETLTGSAHGSCGRRPADRFRRRDRRMASTWKGDPSNIATLGAIAWKPSLIAAACHWFRFAAMSEVGLSE